MPGAQQKSRKPLLTDEARIRILLGLLAITFLSGAVGALLVLLSGLDGPTKLGAVGDLLAGGAFLLALVAAVVATLAYRVTVLKPDLRAEVRFGHGQGGLTVYLRPPDSNGIQAIAGMDSEIHIHLHNYGPVSARNPALKVKLVAVRFGRAEVGWVFGDHLHGLGIFASAQWDGGADFSIHPNWGRDLPLLRLSGVGLPLTVAGKAVQPEIHLEVVADGFSDSYQLPVMFKESK